jgi:hypothetical protein
MSDSAVVFRTQSDNEAAVVKSLLESYGIPVSLAAEHLVQTVYPMTIEELTLSVPEEVVDEALRILEAHRTEGSLETYRSEGDATEI